MPTPVRRTAHPRGNNHKPKKTAMLLAQRIVSEVADRKLPSGAPLLPEHEMLREYDVARGTLREALRFLEILGVITIKTGPGGGPVVAEPESRHLASIIAMMLELDGAPFRAVMEARVTLEPALARKAALRISEPELEHLGDSVRRMREQIDDPTFFLEENEVFHKIIARAAGNQVFSMFILSLNWIIDGSALGVEYPKDARGWVANAHSRIYQAIRSHDGDRAAAAMGVHLGDFAAYLERGYPHIVDAIVRWDQVD